MTREEAIKIIDCYDIGFYDLSGEKIPADKLADAFDMAIEALQTIDNCDQCEWCCPSDGIPTIHVVRCKDCRHRYEEGDCTHYYWCRLNDRPVDDTDYCAWGEESEVDE